MSEPDYIAQTGECETPEQRKEWLRERVAVARERGCVHGRASWDERPDDEGEPRFQLTAEGAREQP